MIIKALKNSILNYWQENVFIISIGLLLFKIIKFNMTQNSFDSWDIALLSFIFPLFICLIGQFYWKNKALSTALSILLLMCSLIIILMAFYFIGTTSSKLTQAILMLLYGILSLLTAITMVIKNINMSETISEK